ncbi:hypothetical protein TNCT_40721 [Trichonephila clavata]|uniref:Uncharacterized protein n=1 Tax=Trichonephila clavata TaxID=2740835 RepID=A0A8X6H318_TRICU|nr:hypothetical protein TNCT_40721 [Trichonephila clavata]
MDKARLGPEQGVRFLFSFHIPPHHPHLFPSILPYKEKRSEKKSILPILLLLDKGKREKLEEVPRYFLANAWTPEAYSHKFSLWAEQGSNPT